MISKYVGDPLFHKVETGDKTYYINTEVVNAADHVLVDTHNPDSRGFGGSTFELRVPDGVDTVKGPWHGTCPYWVLGVTELHYSKVLVVANYERIPYDEWNSSAMDKGCTCMECSLHIKGKIVYQEHDMVLGSFHRGDRIGQQLANLRNEVLYLHVETAGGSHSHECKPNGALHPLANRSGRNTYAQISFYRDDDLSAEQEGTVYD